MKTSKVVTDKSEKFKELNDYQLISLDKEEDFVFITSMAAQICKSKVSLISLFNQEKQWFLSYFGLKTSEIPQNHSLCSLIMSTPNEAFIIEDANKVDVNVRTALHELDSTILFFAGVPLLSHGGNPLGVLCVFDDRAKKLSKKSLKQLKGLAQQTEKLFEYRKKSIELELLNRELEKKNELLLETQYVNRIGTWEMSLKTGKTIWSDAVYEIHGVSKDFDHNKVNGIEFYHVDYRPLITEALNQCIEHGKPMDLICQMHTAQNNLIWVRATGRKVGDILIGSFQDITEIKNSEIRYKSVIDGTNVGTWEWNVQTGATIFNERWAEIVGYTLGELSPININTWINLCHPEDLLRSNKLLNECFNNETEYYEIEIRMKHKDGHWVWVFDRGKIFEWTEDHKPLMMYGTHQDITERKHKEDMLRISEEAFRGNFENAAIGMALQDEKGKWLKVNDKVCDIFGYSQKELQHLTLQDLTHPEDLKTHLKPLKELLEGKREHFHLEKRFCHKKGSTVHILLAASLVRDYEGKILYFIYQFIDISQKKIVEKKLREAVSSLESVLQASKQVSIIASNTKGNITLFNSGAEKILGYKAKEMIGKRSSLTIHRNEEISQIRQQLSLDYSKDLTGFDALVYEAKMGISNTKEWTYVRKDGTYLPVLLSIDAILDGQTVIGYLEVATDITDLKNVENEIKSLLDITNKQNEKLRNFADIVSHNLRSHSGGITGILDLLRIEYPKLLENELVQLLVSGAENLRLTVADLNEIIKVNLTNLVTSEVSVYDAIQKNEDILNLQIKSSNFTIIKQVDKHLTVEAIPAYIDSIILNMMTNAIKYRSLKRQSYLKIYAIDEKSSIILCFEDNGLGIDLKMHHHKLFNLYKTFHNHEDSRGLGLFMTKNQVESMGGDIEVESKVDVGTIFKIILPK